ncbi:hypothetical protein G9A89_012498 [Geosiphon pyriformis]|nr:hypothetical protein G9A89_012498 [Geosiphon pyriformis]
MHPQTFQDTVTNTWDFKFTELKANHAQAINLVMNGLSELDSKLKQFKSAFNFYINKKIAYLLGTPVNTESARETFYSELIQNTSLSTNHNFASIITEINKEIEHHTQQRYPITYASKGKGKLQTSVITPKRIQPPT